MSTNLPIIVVCIISYYLCLQMSQSKLKLRLDRRKFQSFFHGTTRLGEALAVVIRSVAEWKIQQHSICLQLSTKNMTGEKIARELVSLWSTAYLLINCQNACETGHCPIMRWCKPLRFCIYVNVLDIGCYSHTTDPVRSCRWVFWDPDSGGIYPIVDRFVCS